MGDVVDPRAPTRSLGPTPVSPAEAPPPGATLRDGERVGRYVVERCIDRGGMGIVYQARDESLGRGVALKLIIAGPAGADPARAARLVREARAAAALSHPHVVAVYEVGTHEGVPFLAMELIEGLTLERWLEAAPRRWPEVVRVFTQVGQGLAAAHRAGLVHRDVKPANILVGDDRARVADFGLARAAAEPPEAGAEEAPPEGGDRLTRTGEVLGTPRYMAPEQRAGLAVDARADQFSFCVTLAEALEGRPGVPSWLRAVVARGRELDPAARYPSMDALLVDLGRERRLRGRLAIATAAAALLGGGAAVALVVVPGGRPEPCAGAERQLAGVWDAAVKQRVGAAFAARGGAAVATWGQLAPLLDGYARDWTAMHASACKATRVTGEQSAGMLDRRMACLDRRRRALELFAGELTAVDAKLVETVMSRAQRLPRVAECGDLGELAAGLAPGAYPQQRAVGDDLVIAHLHLMAYRDAEGAAAAQRAVDAARAAGDRVREAEGLVLLGRLQYYDGAKAIVTLSAALEAAAEAKATHLRVDALKALSESYMRVGRMREAGEALAGALAALHDAPDRVRQADVTFTEGIYHARSGRFEEARASFERALALWTEELGPDSQVLNVAHANLALVYRRLGRPDEAMAQARRSFELARLLGEDHPATAQARADIAMLLQEQGHVEQALAEQQRAVAALRAAYGEAHEEVALGESRLGEILGGLGRRAEAGQHQRRAVAIMAAAGGDVGKTAQMRGNLAETLASTGNVAEAEAIARDALATQLRVYGAEHPNAAENRRQLGEVLVAAGRIEAALVELEEARRVTTAALGPEHPAVAETLAGSARAERARRKPAAALAHDQRALEILEKALPERHPDRARARLALAHDHLLLRQAARAVPHADAALAVLATSADPGEAGEARWAAARAQWEGGGDRARALELADAARASYEAAGATAEASEVAATTAGWRRPR